MNAFISTDRDTILERLQGEKLLNMELIMQKAGF